MDQTGQSVFDEKLRQDVEKALVQKLITSLEANEIDLKVMKQASNYILDNVLNVKDHKSLLLFLNELQKKWEIFKEVGNYYNYQSDDYKLKEKQVMDKLSSYIKGIN